MDNSTNISDQELYRSLGRIEGALTALALSVTNIATSHSMQTDRINDLDANQSARISRIEGRINFYIGAAGALGSVGALLLRELLSKVTF